MEYDYIECGDCLELMKDIPDKSIDLIMTDIPFNISRKNNFKTMKDRQGRNGIDFGEWDKSFDETKLLDLANKLKDGGSLILFHSFEQHSALLNIFENSLVIKDRFIWEKTNPMPRNRDRRYISNIEMGSWFVTPKGKWVYNRQNETYDTCVFRYPSESGGGFKRYHPCQKNLKMIEELILRHSNEHDIILDPFLGSGTTAVACVNTNRHYIGFELDPQYYDIACKRLDEVEGVLNGIV